MHNVVGVQEAMNGCGECRSLTAKFQNDRENQNVPRSSGTQASSKISTLEVAKQYVNFVWIKLKTAICHHYYKAY